jgi:hypothetical protein
VSKDEVTKKMLEIFEELNNLAMQAYGVPDSEIQQMTERSRPHIYAVQVEIYNFLVEKGLIETKA